MRFGNPLGAAAARALRNDEKQPGTIANERESRALEAGLEGGGPHRGSLELHGRCPLIHFRLRARMEPASRPRGP
jgi:hypothetical protein